MENLNSLVNDLQIPNKLFIPNPRLVTSLKPFLEISSEKTLSFDIMQIEYDAICYERNYHRVSESILG